MELLFVRRRRLFAPIFYEGKDDRIDDDDDDDEKNTYGETNLPVPLASY